MRIPADRIGPPSPERAPGAAREHEAGGGPRAGFALEATLLVLLLMSGLVAALFSGALSNYRSTQLEYENSRTFYAAEGGAEVAMAQLAIALEDGDLSTTELQAISPPSMSGFSFDSFYVEKVGGVEIERITDGSFAGLYSLTQRVNIFSQAQDRRDVSSAVMVSAKAQAIPIFQFGIFYEEDLEITNGPPMTFEGWVHSNGTIYLSSDNAWYRNLISTPEDLIHDRKDANNVYNGVFINNASGDEVQLDFDSRDTPDAGAFRNESDAKFDNRLKTGAYGVDTLHVPLPDGMSPHEIIRPREATDGTLERENKFAWKADWYIEVDLTILNDSNDESSWLCSSAMTQTRPAGKVLPGQTDCSDIFNFDYERFYEGREGRFADVLDIDLQKLFNWVGGDNARATGVLYVKFTGNGVDDSGDGVFPVVRLVDGDWLASPLTIATDRPIYVLGDYNTAGWQPAAIVGDAMTWLSTAWNDADHQGPGLTNAANTAVYAAVLVGHSATPCDWFDAGCLGGNYGGGVENFSRFLESWDGRTMTYYGSLVSLFTSVEAQGPWSYGSYYTAPNRDWNFDTRFQDPSNLPPGTPVVGNVIHTAFRPVH